MAKLTKIMHLNKYAKKPIENNYLCSYNMGIPEGMVNKLSFGFSI
jgi:hypothetical protein